MWYIISTSDPSVKYCLLVGKDYIVGRKDANILIADDQTVSRKHSVLQVSHPESSLAHTYKLPLLVLKDESKFGTWVNSAKLPQKGETSLKDGDEIKFGSPKSAFMCVYEPLIVTTSCLETAAKKDVKALVCKLGGHVIHEWRKDCSLLLMSNLSVTVKVVSALVSQKPVVTPAYLTQLQVTLEAGTDQPDPLKFLPPLTEPHLNPRDVSFGPDPDRKTLLEGKRFIFLNTKQFKKLNMAVELAGGTPMLMEEGTDDNDDDIVVAADTVVMSADPSEPTLSQNGKDWVKLVQELLVRHGKRMIPDAEIGYAILFCSTEKHCNPDIDPAHAIHVALPSQSLSERPFSQEPQVLVPNSEMSQACKKTPGRVGKGGKQNRQIAEEIESTSKAKMTKVNKGDKDEPEMKSDRISVKVEPETPGKGDNTGSRQGQITIEEEFTDNIRLDLRTSPRKSSRKRGHEAMEEKDAELKARGQLMDGNQAKNVKTEKLSQEMSRTLTEEAQRGGKIQQDGSSSDDMGPPVSRPQGSKRGRVLVEDTELDSLFQTNPRTNRSSKRRNYSGTEARDRVSDSDPESKPPISKSRAIARSGSSSDEQGPSGGQQRYSREITTSEAADSTKKTQSVHPENVKTERSGSYSDVPDEITDTKPVVLASREKQKHKTTSAVTGQGGIEASRHGNVQVSSRSPSPIRKSPGRRKIGGRGSPSRDDMKEDEQERRSVNQARRPVDQDVECREDNMEQDRPAMLEGVVEGDVPAGFLTTRIPIGEQVDVNENFVKEESDVTNLVVTEFKSLVVRLPRGHQISHNVADKDGYIMWKGKKVKNFKKFRKSEHVGSGMLPHIIGGRDLEAHTNTYRKEIDDWYKEAMQAESQQNEEDRMASQLFDWDASSKGKTRRSR